MSATPTATVSGLSLTGTRVYCDTRNAGSPLPSDPWCVANSANIYRLDSPTPINSNQPIRQLISTLPAGVTQTAPLFQGNPGGIHINVAIGATNPVGTADFVNSTSVPPVPPKPPVTQGGGPVAVPIAETPYSVGWCLQGVSGPGASVAQIIADTAPLGGCNAVNMWLETPTMQAVPDSQFNSTRAFNAEKIRSFLSCMNPQNTPAPNRTKYPTDGGAAYFNSFPNAADIGNPVLILSDEHDNADYNTDTPENFAHMLSVACLILPKKGYTDLCLTWIRGMGWIQQPNVAAVIKANPVITRMGHHAMDQTAASSLAEHDAARTYVEKVVGRIYEITQGGLHNANWGVEVPALYSGLRSRGIPALAFPLYRGPLNAQGQTQQPACNCAPYISPGVKNPVIFDGMVKAIVGAA